MEDTAWAGTSVTSRPQRGEIRLPSKAGGAAAVVSSLRGVTPTDGGRMLGDVRQGLLAKRKSLPPTYFYDARGSALFE